MFHPKAGTFDYALSDISVPARAQNGNARIQNTENMLDQLDGLKLKHHPPVILTSDYAAAGVEETVDVMRLAIATHSRGVVDIIAKPFPGNGRTLDRVIKKVLAGKAEKVRITWPVSGSAEEAPKDEPAAATSVPAQTPAKEPAAAEAKEGRWMSL